MTDITELTDDLDIDLAGYSDDDLDDIDEESADFLRYAQQLVDDDDPLELAQEAVPELAAQQQANLRLTAMEIQQDIQYAQDDFKRLNPDATEAQVEEYVAAVFERDIVTLDRVQKEVQRKHQEIESAEASDKGKSVLLNTTDTAQNGGAVENRFTGQNTISGIRRILFGNS